MPVQNADLNGYRYRRSGLMINGAEGRGGEKFSDIGTLEQSEQREKEKSK